MFDDLEFDPEKIPTYKLGLHITQIVITFVLWCLEIAVFRNDKSDITGQNGWTFGVCFLSIPAWVYLVMTPRFPRTRKLAQPHAMLVVDALFTIIWISAFSTQAAYNTANKCGTACGISKAIVGLGFFVFLLFVLTTFLSTWTLKYYQLSSRMPGYDKINVQTGQSIDPDKAAFSTTPHDDYAPIGAGDQDELHDLRDPYAPPGSGGNPYGGGSTSVHGGSEPSAPGRAPSSFAGAGSVASRVDPYSAAMASETGYSGVSHNPVRPQHSARDEDTEYRPGDASNAEPAHFPSGNYDRIERFGLSDERRGV